MQLNRNEYFSDDYDIIRKEFRDMIESVFKDVTGRYLPISSAAIFRKSGKAILYSNESTIYSGSIVLEIILHEEFRFKVLLALGHELEMEDILTNEEIEFYKGKTDKKSVYEQLCKIDEYLRMIIPKKFFENNRW